MKKLMLIALAAASVGIMASCSVSNSLSNGIVGNTQSNTLDFKQIYSMSAISSISLFDNVGSVRGMRKALTDADKERIIQNFEMVEKLISNNAVVSEEKPSTIAGYETMYEITITDLDNTQDVYTYHYNEVARKQERDEEEIYIEGIVIHDDVTYSLVGEKELEDNEVEMSFKVSLDQNTFVTIEQESEDGENGFEYALFENGRKVYETELEYEVERGKIEYEFEEKSTSGTREYKFVTKNVNGQVFIIAEIKENGQTTYARFHLTTDENGNRVYQFD